MFTAEIQPSYTVASLETLRVLSDPLRLELVEEITRANARGETRTVKQLAEAAGTRLHKLYYHIRLLEEHGLIRVAETQMVSGIVEKHYAVAAWQIEIEEGLLDRSPPDRKQEPPAAISLFDTIVRRTRAQLAALLAAVGTGSEHPARLSGRRGHMTHDEVHLTPAQAEAFHARLLALTEEFSARKGRDPVEGRSTYTLLTVMIPNLPGAARQQEDHPQ